ncbi:MULTISPECIES: GH36-type glycosyl hydrolase domain-containing protein [unclassified Oceanispirochaeta]|uniref:GH36-type glycosyl hydrolase domain-containing protein n=1 Tax=unclassified Oceanispirochaeta TaxID=2635722 RepID=UPI000E098120|nr:MULTISPECIES: hypothetical protein [unclassified Oceanispirochaeta]MBF9017613.1 hypothetical protein [Oceanispirochaeta sp. M2]NPD74185.1 hypothetical protein [Oceanispirochaeta sp. M1]RDG29998.1 hypothetical protein DV872_18975 [Oceanispirochaeta sp. M1]
MNLFQKFPQGAFSPDGETFTINTAHTPRSWTNHLWNKNFLSVFSQSGQGYSLQQDQNGIRKKLTKGRMLYFIENEELYCINGLASEAIYDKYECEHHTGYSVIRSSIKGFSFSWTCFVPVDESCEIWQLEITNTEKFSRSVRIIAALNTAIGERQDITSTSGEWNSELEILSASNVIRHGAWFHHATDGSKEKGFFSVDRKPDAYDCRRSAIFGPYGSPTDPVELKKSKKLPNNPAEFENIAFSFQMDLNLDAAETENFVFANGLWENPDEIRKVKEKYLSPGNAQKALEILKKEVRENNSGATIETGEKAFDLFVNSWLKHQTQFNSTWARIYYNGFRDLCQDNGNMAFIHLDQGEARLAETLKRQYASGFAPRGWCEGQLIEQNYADSPVWIVNAVYNLVMERGNTDFLMHELEFHDQDTGNVYEHTRRAVEYLWNDRGSHGLSRIHGGDWNDMLNGAGTGGKGESMWLSMALLHALPMLRELSGLVNDTQTAEKTLQQSRELLDAIESHGWDGDWYIRGFTDSGRTIGSKTEEEGQCYLNTQAWAVISGTGREGRALHAIESAEKLLDTEKGLATLSKPYTQHDEEIGYLSDVRPGTNTNGGIYIHSNAFKIMADCLLKRPDAAWKSLVKILPFSEARIPFSGPPYSLPNSYLGPESGYRFGDYGGAWITGTAGWVHTVIMNYLFGIRPVWNGLLVDPCLPGHWKEASMRRSFRGADYDIQFMQNTALESMNKDSEWKIIVNNETLEGRILPCVKGEFYRVEIVR